MSPTDLNILPWESEMEYINRIGEMKCNGLLDMTWNELADVFNKNLREPGEKWTESAYRKKFASIQKVLNEFGGDSSGKDSAEDITELLRELEKEKVKVRDERNEYRRLIREEARKESYREQFIRAITDSVTVFPLRFVSKINRINFDDADMIIPLTDIHAGIESDNFWNHYNADVLKKRFEHYLERIFEIQKRHGCRNAYVVGSEFLSGIIHPALRIENNQDLIDQFLTVTNYLCDFLSQLSERFEEVNFYVAPGNHSRINPKKEQDLAHENMDNLIIPFVRAKMQNYENIHCYENLVEQSMAMFNVRGLSVVAVHGDKDNPDKVVNNLWNMLHARIDLLLLGHRHTNALSTHCDVKVVQSGCMSGTDSYAIDIRKSNRPEQAIMIITDREGLDCIYDVKF